MPDHRFAICRHCGGHRDEVGPLSWNRYCGICGPMLSVEASAQMKYRSGPRFNNWRRGMILSAGGILPERLDTTPERR